jgi:hypothetical protein
MRLPVILNHSTKSRLALILSPTEVSMMSARVTEPCVAHCASPMAYAAKRRVPLQRRDSPETDQDCRFRARR